MPSRLSKKALPFLLILPASVFVFPLMIYPIFSNAYLSFFSWGLLTPQLRPAGFQIYWQLITDGPFLRGLFVTLIFTVAVVSAQFFWGLGFSMLLNKEIRGKRFFRALAIVPFLSPPSIMALIWRLLWDPDLGPINALLRTMGIQGPAWIAQRSTALFSVVFTETWRGMPFVALVLLAGFQSLPQDPYDASRVDGASSWQMFRYLTLPLLKPIITIILLFQTIFTLRSFETIWVLTEGGPGGATETLSVLIYKILFRFFKGGEAAAFSVVMLIITGIICLFFFRILYREMET